MRCPSDRIDHFFEAIKEFTATPRPTAETVLHSGFAINYLNKRFFAVPKGKLNQQGGLTIQ